MRVARSCELNETDGEMRWTSRRESRERNSIQPRSRVHPTSEEIAGLREAQRRALLALDLFPCRVTSFIVLTLSGISARLLHLKAIKLLHNLILVLENNLFEFVEDFAREIAGQKISAENIAPLVYHPIHSVYEHRFCASSLEGNWLVNMVGQAPEHQLLRCLVEV